MGQAGASGATSDERPSIQDDEVRETAPEMADATAPGNAPGGPRRGRTRLAIGAVLAGAVVVAGVVWIVAGHGTTTHAGANGASSAIEITTTSCGTGWKPANNVSQQSFTIRNKSGHPGEIYLLDAQGGIVDELEGLGPGVERPMTEQLANGSYKWLCVMSDQPTIASAVQQVSGSSAKSTVLTVLPASEDELKEPVAKYQAYVAPKLGDLLGQVTALRTALAAGNTGAAKTAWMTAQLTWEQVGAAYGSFEDLGDAIGGLPSGLPKGVNDPDFTGLHRVEYGLYHGESASTLLPVVDKLSADVTELRGKLPQLTIDPNDLSLRAHEILEDALRDHLTGATDLGSGAGFAETYADLQGTRVVMDELTALINKRNPDIVPQAKTQMATLEQVLLANKHGANWTTLSQSSLYDRQQVNAAVSALLETLSAVPDLLEIRSAAQATK